MKLLKTAEFVQEQYNLYLDDKISVDEYAIRTSNHAKIILLKPELKRFVACDEDGKPIEKPKEYSMYLLGRRLPSIEEIKICIKYQKALDRIWFEGWESGKVNYTDGAIKGKLRLQFFDSGTAKLFKKDSFDTVIRTIEDIIDEIDLTSTAAFDKEVGINK